MNIFINKSIFLKHFFVINALFSSKWKIPGFLKFQAEHDAIMTEIVRYYQ